MFKRFNYLAKLIKSHETNVFRCKNNFYEIIIECHIKSPLWGHFCLINSYSGQQGLYIQKHCFSLSHGILTLHLKVKNGKFRLFSVLRFVMQMFSFWGFSNFCFQFVSFGCFGFWGVPIISALQLESRLSRRRL